MPAVGTIGMSRTCYGPEQPSCSVYVTILPLRFARVVYPLWMGSLSKLPRPCCCCAEPLLALQITQDT